jgi:hypothetical protein
MRSFLLWLMSAVAISIIVGVVTYYLERRARRR